ncbi:hypothetical protein K466DRAFT_606549 [Polyporus arcularius HHB13444]|uniref:F-box domain-containing protein n=1 Tax=Polyporus arcularius HHB13444 TaxID=1314778 RepID=A0A5C3NQA9_9APHY|nr:hypothetical protein K466DRAFT_606549 [Polyporus arcularius HHB13444]
MSPRNYPFLRVLEITSIDSIPRNAESYTGLLQLSLSTCWLDISLDQFLDIISACTRLESLSFNDFFAGLAHQGRTSRLGPAPWRPLISLPQLTTLMLEDEFHHDVARFLAHLVLSPAVELGIHAVFHPSGGPARMSAALPANRATTLPLLSTVTSVELDMSPDEYVLRAAKDAIMRNDDAVLSLVSTEHVDWYDYLRHGLRDLVDIFQAAPLTRLSVAGNYDCVADPNDWRTVFAAFPKLRELECYAFGTSSTTLLWTVLSHDEAAQAVLCPELQSIRMYGCRIKGSQEAGSFFESMHACLRSRTMPEGRGMQRLDLEVQSQGQELDERLRRDYGPTLQNLVDEVRLNFKPYY